MENQLTNESRRRWNEFADDYAQRTRTFGDLHKEVLLTPHLLEIVGDVEGKIVLDAGCGEGYLSRLLADKGANVTAVDFSDRMIDLAEERTGNSVSIQYEQANLESLTQFSNARFDLIVSNMVIQDVSNLKDALSEMNRVLKKEGHFVFSVLHPCFITPVSGWEKDDAGAKLHWNVDNYFKEGQYEQRFGTEDKVFAFHRTLSTYFNTLLEIGFTVTQMVEPVPSEDHIKQYAQFEEDLRVPDFIIFNVKKVMGD